MTKFFGKTEFKRGQVIMAEVPKFDAAALIDKEGARTPKPSFILNGEHRFVVLHDSDAAGMDKRLCLVLPITSAKSEVDKAQKQGRSMLESYIPLLVSDYTFLKSDSYISTSQIMPINRNWFTSGILGSVAEEKLHEINLQMINNQGLMETVMALAQDIAAELFADWIGQTAAGDAAKNG